MSTPGRLDREAYPRALSICQDNDRNQDGTITISDLDLALQTAFPSCTEEQRGNLLADADMNGDGIVQYQEFWDWVQLKPEERCTFAERVEAIRKRFGPEPVAAAGPADTSSRAATPVEDANLYEIIEPFTHPLLSRLVFCEPTQASTVNKVLVRHTMVAGGRDGPAVFASSARGRLEINVSIPRLSIKDGPQRFLEVLETLASAYLRVFETYCGDDTKPGKGFVVEGSTLRMEMFELQDDRREPVIVEPELLWSAMAVAFVRLVPQVRERLAQATVEFVYRGNGALRMREALEAKKTLAAEVHRIDAEDYGSLATTTGNYDWVRHSTTPEHRLLRMQAFFLTMHASCWGGVSLPAVGTQPRPRKLELNVDRMISGVTKREGSLASLALDPNTPVPATRVLHPEGLDGYPGGGTAMEVASFLGQQQRVVVLNAASAYHAGGGATTGGRHALEEAWCTTSTLYSALEIVPRVPKASYVQHIPTRGCVIAPDVEIFRQPTSRGYGFMTEAVRVAGVVSVAMFNRNPGISDSPVDCPEDPAMYLNQTFVKLRCCVEAAAELNADVMVVPDVGCGVFHNDPRIIGGCFGRAIRECGASLPAVVITTHNEDFNEAFLRALHGEDPRPTCRLGGYCPNLGDPKHAACFAHEGVELNAEGQDPVLAALMLLAEYPKVIAKPMCRYGFACTQTRNPRHMEKFDHPSADDQDRKVGRGRPAGAERGRAPQQPPLDRVPSAGRRRQPVTPSGDSIGAAHGALGAQPRERCKYGEKCFRTAADHKREFSHPGDPDWDCHPSAFGHTASYGPSSGGREQYPPAREDSLHGGTAAYGSGGHAAHHGPGGVREYPPRDHHGPTSGGREQPPARGTTPHGASGPAAHRGPTSAGREQVPAPREDSLHGGAAAQHGPTSAGREQPSAQGPTSAGREQPPARRGGRTSPGAVDPAAAYGPGADALPTPPRLAGAPTTPAGAPSGAADVPAAGLPSGAPDARTNGQGANPSAAAPRRQPRPVPAAPTTEQIQKVHGLLNDIKKSQGGRWGEVINQLNERPDLVNIRPSNRNFGFIHFAAHHVKYEVGLALINLGADPNLPSGDGSTPQQVLTAAMAEKPASNVEQAELDRKFVELLEEVAGGTPAPRGGAAAAPPEPPSIKPNGNVLTVSGCPPCCRELNGEYKEITAKGACGYPSYWKDRGDPQFFLYYTPANLWVIDDTLTRRACPRAYLQSCCGDEVWMKTTTERWSVRQAHSDSLFSESRTMRIAPPRGSRYY